LATLDLLEPGDRITIDFHSVVVEVLEIGDERAVVRVQKGGRVGHNKACNVHRNIELPPSRSRTARPSRLGDKWERIITHFPLPTAGDVREMRALIGADARLISKIESLNGVAHAERSPALRRDFDRSRRPVRQVPLPEIPACQKDIMRRVKTIGRPVYVATNLLESMVHSPVPTLAEVNDIYNTLNDGAEGLVLAAETAWASFRSNASKWWSA